MSTNSNHALLSKIVLSLLDDQPALKPAQLDWSPQNLPKKMGGQGSAILGPKQKTKSANLPNAFSTPRIFRQSSTLKELMSEYNTKRPTMTIQKSSSNGSDFSPERIEHIRLPEIPGKILRPYSSRS